MIREKFKDEELEYKALSFLELNPQVSQRQISAELGVSLGKAHYLLRALIDVGLIKLGNFRKSKNKLGYSYVLTPAGVTEKATIAIRFLHRKQLEYSKLQTEIKLLQEEVNKAEKSRISY